MQYKDIKCGRFFYHKGAYFLKTEKEDFSVLIWEHSDRRGEVFDFDPTQEVDRASYGLMFALEDKFAKAFRKMNK